MYYKLFGRLPAGQARHYLDHSKRQIDANGRLTAPITFTITSIRPAQPSSSSSATPPTVTVTKTVVSSSSSTSASASSSVLVNPGPTSTSISSLVSSETAPVPTAGTDPSAESTTSKVMDASRNGGERQNGLPAGAIAGMVIALLLVTIALSVFLLRRRSLLSRQKRSQSWKDNMFSRGIGGEPMAGGVMGGMSEARPSKLVGNSAGVAEHVSATPYQLTSPMKTIPRVPVPATPTSTYNNAPPSSGLLTPPIVGSPRAFAMPVNGATVVSTFIPSLPDELSISMGEVVRVLAEYDDGWVLCANKRAEQGMVPLECLSQGASTERVYIARDPSLARRASSLTGSGSIRRA